MTTTEFLSLYDEDPFLKILAQPLLERKPAEPSRVQVKGITGSLDAVIAATLTRRVPGTHLFVLTDREEASYFFNDLQNLHGFSDRPAGPIDSLNNVLLFPMSYKKPYQYEEIENANVLMRAEVLNRVSLGPGKIGSSEGSIIVTYPEALSEKVINKRSLRANTMAVRIGDKLDTSFVSDMLQTYAFEKTDFVYEAGQFSVRGGHRRHILVCV